MKHLLKTIHGVIEGLSDPEKAVVMLRMGIVTSPIEKMNNIRYKMKIPESHIRKIESEVLQKVREAIAPDLWPKGHTKPMPKKDRSK